MQADRPLPDPALEPCPFCGRGECEIKENGRTWTGMRWGEPSSVSVWHWCTPIEGQPSRAIERVGRDRASAIAAWNMRAALATLQGLSPAQASPKAQPDMAKIEQDAVGNAMMLCLPKITQAYRYNYAQGKTEKDFDNLAGKAMGEAVRYAVKLTAREVADPVWPYAAAPAQATLTDVFDTALKETWQMVDPLNPGQPGSYYAGQHSGIVAALRTIKENFARAAIQAALPRGEEPTLAGTVNDEGFVDWVMRPAALEPGTKLYAGIPPDAAAGEKL